MKSIHTIRNSLIIILCCTVVCMGIGFIVLSMQLKKEKDKEETFRVVFSKVEKTSSVKGSNISPEGKAKVIHHGLGLDMEFQLNAFYDEITYVATIHNEGSIAAEIVGLTESPSYSEERFQKLISPVAITLSDVQGKIVPPGGDTTLKITVFYSPAGDTATSKTIPYKIGLLARSYE